MGKTYFDPKDLKKFGKITASQEKMGTKFFDCYNSVFEGDTALTQREKALIALAVAHTVQCPYCIDAYTTGCLEEGADEEQMMEAVHVSAAIKGGATLVYGVQMMNHSDKLSM
jgi:alkylhydroperoxidase/carboxymuconolactone decarboxylase family protein